jgi:hypothetical protein
MAIFVVHYLSHLPNFLQHLTKKTPKPKEDVMKKSVFQKAKTIALGSFFICAASALRLHAVESPEDKINEWINECPYIGLVAKEVSYGPITLKNFNLDNKGRIVIARPNEIIHGTLQYKIKTDELPSLHLHHIIIGIEGEDTQSCITHALGVWDTKGKTSFSFAAPPKRGVYEIRVDYQTGLTCEEACKLWREDPPSAKATVGIIIIE